VVLPEAKAEDLGVKACASSQLAKPALRIGSTSGMAEVHIKRYSNYNMLARVATMTGKKSWAIAVGGSGHVALCC